MPLYAFMAPSTSAVLHVRVLYVFETNTHEYVLEVFARIYARIFAYVFVRINVRTPKRIFVRIWTCSARIPVSRRFVSARIPVRICTYPSSYLHVFQSVSACVPVRICTYPVHIPFCICSCPVLFLHLQFDAHSAKYRLCWPAKIPHTLMCTQSRTQPRSLCRLCLTPSRPCLTLSSGCQRGPVPVANDLLCLAPYSRGGPHVQGNQSVP